MITCPCGDTVGPFVRTPEGPLCETCAEKKDAQ